MPKPAQTLTLCSAVAFAAALVSPSLGGPDLTPAEKAAGWRVLFDGESWDGWRGYRQEGPPSQGWAIEDGTLHVMGGGGDIVTVDEFEDFELSLEFKVSPLANSGIIYRVDESQAYPWMTGPEYQVLDDNRDEADNRLHSVGAVYDLYTPSEDKPTRPVGEWNHARIRISDGVVKHFLNGAKVAEYDMNSEAWRETIAGSKFKAMEGFGVQPKGRIALQDHGDDVWYRNIKVRDLDARLPREVRVFDHRKPFEANMVLPGAQGLVETFTYDADGTLRVSGTPKGYIESAREFGDFVLRLEWRYPEQAGNSGVLLRTVGEDKVWPDCVEAQLMSGNAGDFVNLSGEEMTMPRAEGRFGRRSHDAERPLGEWNEYEIIARGGEITLMVNGETVNHATGCPTRGGTIALQSEGVPIEFRRVRLSEIR